MKKKSFKERFERQLRKEIIEVPFTDDDGEKFTVRCRRLSDSEQRQILAIHEKTQNLKTSQDYATLMDEVYKFLAYPSGIVLEPELTYEFWKNTAFSFQVILQILTTVVNETAKTNLKLVEKYQHNIKPMGFYT